MKMQKKGVIREFPDSRVSALQSAGWSVCNEKLYDIFKVSDGEVAKRASKTGLLMAQADEWLNGREGEYKVIEAE